MVLSGMHQKEELEKYCDTNPATNALLGSTIPAALVMNHDNLSPIHKHVT